MLSQYTKEGCVSGLVFDNISKSFGGTYALGGVSMDVQRGEIVALLGENGAGKSTLIKVLGGIHIADAGSVSIDGIQYQHKPGATNVKQGVAFIHQDLGLIEWMSIAENIALAQGYNKKNKLIDWAECERTTASALARVGCDFSPTQRISSLTRAEKSLVAIARALCVQCDFLVLDEPTASLPLSDVRMLFAVLKQLRDEGVGMIFVSHRLDEIFQIADRVVVLRDGNVSGTCNVSDTSTEELVDLIVGHKPKSFKKSALSKDSKAVLNVKQLTTETIGPIDFTLNSNEVLGLVGLRGAGQEEVGRCIFGNKDFKGDIFLLGSPYQASDPSHAMSSGIGLIPRDRLVESITPSLSIRENIFINPGSIGRKLFSFLGTKKEYQNALEIGDKVGLRPNDPDLSIESLSGGNQQKVIVGRWLQNKNKVLIAEDPTAGVDVGAKAEIYTLLNSILAEDVAVLVISTDFEEVANICNRAIVFNRGMISKELSGDELSMETLIQAASASESTTPITNPNEALLA